MADKPQPAKPAPEIDEQGFLIPNTTQFPNILLDQFMRVVAPGVWKIICAVVRKTYGWQKRWDAISTSQLMGISGLSEQGTKEIVSLLLRSKLLERGEMLNDSKGRNVGYLYRINIACNVEAALQILTPSDRTYKMKKPRSINEGGNSVGGEGATQLDGGGNSVGVQNKLLTKPTNQNQGGAPLSKSVRLMAQKQFIDSIPTGWRQAEKFAPHGVSNLREFIYNQVRIGAKTTGLDYPDAKLFLADHPLWKDWPDLQLLDAQQEIRFPETVAPKPAKLQLPEFDYPAGQELWEFIRDYLKRKLSPHSFDLWIKPLRLIGVQVQANEMYIRVPVEEFKHVREKYSEHIESALQLKGLKDFALIFIGDEYEYPVQR